MSASTNRRYAGIGVGAIALALLGSVTVVPSAFAGGTPPACAVAGPGPVDNPSFSSDPYPGSYDLNLANVRFVFEYFDGTVTEVAQKLACVNGAVTIVDIPRSDRSLVTLSQTTGTDARGDFVSLTGSYTTAGAQAIEIDETAIDGGTVVSQEPVFSAFANGQSRRTIRGYTGKRYVSDVAYVRVKGLPVFYTYTPDSAKAGLAANTRPTSKWTPLGHG